MSIVNVWMDKLKGLFSPGPDLNVRIRAADRSGGRSAGDDPRKPWLEPALADLAGGSRSAALRLVLLKHWPRRPDWPPADLENFLYDSHGGVREYARFLLRKNGATDFAEKYRRQVRSNPSAGALAGLGECGRPEDAALAEPFLEFGRQSRWDKLPYLMKLLGVAEGGLREWIERQLKDWAPAYTRPYPSQLALIIQTLADEPIPPDIRQNLELTFNALDLI